jgi:hypothetical protein
VALDPAVRAALEAAVAAADPESVPLRLHFGRALLDAGLPEGCMGAIPLSAESGSGECGRVERG